MYDIYLQKNEAAIRDNQEIRNSDFYLHAKVCQLTSHVLNSFYQNIFVKTDFLLHKNVDNLKIATLLFLILIFQTF